MRCPICYDDNWKNVDHVRLKPHDMHMCQTCAFVGYPTKYKTEAEILEHYRKEYRPPPMVSHLFTGERKIWYHERVLRPIIESWKEAELKPVIGEIGSAMGMFVKWMSEQIECDIQGTELTTSFRRVAYHEFGVKLTEDLDWSKKYDMIATYHVLEHMMEPDKHLERYFNALSDSGVLYLSVPVWFRDAINSGGQGFSVEYYWAPDHINCWSEDHLEYILMRAGFEPVFKDTSIYGNTYILKKRSTPAELKPVKEIDWKVAKHLEICERQLKCWKHIQQNETAMAIEAYPNCPSAWIHHYEMERAKLDKNREELEKFLNMGIAACPNSPDTLMLAGDVMTRYERFLDGYKAFEQALAKKPQNPTILFAMSNCMRQAALKEQNPEKKAEYLQRALDLTRAVRDTSLEKMGEATSFMYGDQAQMIMEGE